MKAVYVAHPLGNGPDREHNRRRAAKWVAWVADQGHAPVADWIILSGERDESRREEGLRIDFELISRCDELWLVGGHVSPGMFAEYDFAKEHGIPVINFIYLGMLPPP